MNKKSKRTPTQKSYAFKEQLRIGGEIAASLPQLKTQAEVAEHFNITQQMVSRIERQALFKLRMALREAMEDKTRVVEKAEDPYTIQHAYTGDETDLINADCEPYAGDQN
jgi:hypothetical protein